MKRFDKDPDSTNIDYTLNWAGWLTGGDTITAVNVTVEGATDDPGELTIEDTSHTDTTTTVVVSGGAVNRNYRLTFHITTAQDRQDDRSILLVIGEQ